MARSLMDGIDLDKKSGAKKKSGGDPAKTKTYIAIGLLVVAVGVLVWYYGLRGGGTPDIPQMDPVQQQQAIQQTQQNVEQAKQRGAQIGGGD